MFLNSIVAAEFYLNKVPAYSRHFIFRFMGLKNDPSLGLIGNMDETIDIRIPFLW